MDDSDLPAAAEGAERHILKPEDEFRLEVAWKKSSRTCITLQKGSAELWGIELAVNKPYVLTGGGLKLAIFTWYGCVIDIESDSLEIAYVSNETACNVAAVNTHAQLEALRETAAASATTHDTTTATEGGPRVLLVGPKECGKSSLAKTLCAYAVKLGRTPLLVDLDPADNCISVPGTLSCNVMDHESITVPHYAHTGLPFTQEPLVLWHGQTSWNSSLLEPQVTALQEKIQARWDRDQSVRNSGMIVNTHGWIQDKGYDLLLHIVRTMRITVILVVGGHDRLYSMLRKSCGETNQTIIKLPRSGGVVSRSSAFVKQLQDISIKNYFYGLLLENEKQQRVIPQLTPFAIQMKFDQLTIYKLTNTSLAKSLLPVMADHQETEAVALEAVQVTEALKHALLGVCHPASVHQYQQSGNSAKDLMTAGICGICVVERVVMETEVLHLLSPCAGSLPSTTLLVGDVTWME